MALYPVTCFANHTKARSLTRRPSISPLSSLSQAQSHRVAVRRVAAALPPGHGVTASLSQSLVFAHQQPGLEPSRAKTKSTPPSHASLKPWHRDPQKKLATAGHENGGREERGVGVWWHRPRRHEEPVSWKSCVDIYIDDINSGEIRTSALR